MRLKKYAVFFICSYCIADTCFGEVSLDGTLGRSGPISGPDYQIGPALGYQIGTNLFHSFSRFDIASGESATFSGGSEISNIISRVTGGQSSTIDGPLRSSIPRANLFLMNPSGILFGPEASIDIDGSFYATTADYIKLEDGAIYDAIPSSQDLRLTTAGPKAFGFLQEIPSFIAVDRSYLQVNQGKSISLLGGNILIDGDGDLQGFLEAPSGQVNLISVASSGDLAFDAAVNSTLFRFNAFKQFGSILFREASVSTIGNPGGKVFIKGGQFIIEGGGLSSSSTGENDHPGTGIQISVTDDVILDAQQADAFIEASSRSSGKGGDIVIETDHLEMVGGENSGSVIGARVFGSGDAGDLLIDASSLRMANRSFIEVGVFGSGRGGNVLINSKDVFIKGDRAGSYITTGSFNSGAAGYLEINADNIRIDGGYTGFVGVTSQNKGIQGINFGAINPDIKLNNSLLNPSFDSGEIILNLTNRLTINNGAEISSAVFDGTGNAGGINISAEEILISGKNNVGNSSGIYSVTRGQATGDGGLINLRSGLLHVTDGAKIGSNSFSYGDSGSIHINTDHLQIDNGSLVTSASWGLGSAGIINISANDIELKSGPMGISAILSASSVFAKDAGNINIRTNSLNVYDGAALNSVTLGGGKGGDINVFADVVTLTGVDPFTESQSNINARSFPYNPLYAVWATGDGGNIRIDANQIKVVNGGLITTSSASSGDAGSITLSGKRLNLKDGFIQASAATTDGGNIDLFFTDLVELHSSEISTSVGGTGDGGNIVVDPEFVILDSARIIANATIGNGGNIHIIADHFFRSPDSLINASSQQGIDGSIVIDSPETGIISSIDLLPTDFLNIASILATPCTQRSATDVSRFVVRRYQVLPDSPYALKVLNSTNAVVDSNSRDQSLQIEDICRNEDF